MWYAFAKDYKRVFWASEWWMIDAACRAENVELAAEGEQGFRFFPTDEDLHYKFDVGLFITATNKVKPKTKPIKGREPEPVVTAVRGDDPFGRPGNVCGINVNDHRAGIHTRELSETATTTSTTSSRGKTPRSPDNVIKWLGTDHHPYAGYIDKEKFDELAKYGCSWCSQSVEFGEPGITIFERDDLLLCGKCSGHSEIDDDTDNRIYIDRESFNVLRA
jgi:hypothetical protein